MKYKDKFKLLLEIFTTFFKIGGFTFGGGYAMIPLIEKEVVENKKWIDEKEVIDVFAVSQSLPGAIAINSATFIGYKICGRIGSIFATAGVVMPSFIIITLIAIFFGKFQDLPLVKAVFSGIRPAIVSLIFMAAVRISKKSIMDKIGVALAALSIILVVFFDVQAIFVIIGGAAVGFVINSIFPRQADKILSNGGKKD